MKNRVRVEVTQKDIESGVCENPNQCAIAKSLQRFERRVKRVYVGGGCNIRFDGFDWRVPSIKESIRVDGFIIRFDNGENVKPFSFTMVKRGGDS